MNKKYKLSTDEIIPLVENKGGCICSIRITVDGSKVGFCYREEPDNDIDSGWRFMAGDESDEYMNDANNVEVYGLNTIANYDPRIIPLLDAPVGSAYMEKDGKLILDSPPKSWWRKFFG